MTEQKLDEIGAVLENSLKKSMCKLEQQIGVSKSVSHVATKLFYRILRGKEKKKKKFYSGPGLEPRSLAFRANALTS